MKNLLTISLALLLGGGLTAQLDAKEKDLRTKAKGVQDSTKTWAKGAIINLGFGQSHLSNWAAGGMNSYSFNGLLSLYANHSKGKLAWDNSLDLEYGSILQFTSTTPDSAKNWFKNSDRIELNSKLGYEAGGHWYYTMLLNFRSQMAPGYDGGGANVISDIASPAYTTFALGMDYKPNKSFSVFISPIAYRMLYVSRASLRNSFGIENAVDSNGDPILDALGVAMPGKALLSELGAYIKMNYVKDEPLGIKNVNFKTDLALFSNYLRNPENIDIYWNTIIGLKVNKLITATVSTNLIYDHDITITTNEERLDENGDVMKGADGKTLYIKGPRVQFKEALTVGFSYQF